MRTLYIIPILFIAGSILSSCGQTDDQSNDQLTEKAIKVEVIKVENQEQNNYVKASGQLQAVNSANLSTRFMGHISSLNVKTGDQVREGQLLMSLNSKDLQAKSAQASAAVDQAKAAYENASKDYERFKNLHMKGSASDKELENMKSRFEMSKAGLKAAKNMKAEVESQFDYLNIKAPFKGTIVNVFVKEGDLAKPGYPLASIEALDQMEAQLMISESDISKIEEGQKAEVHIKSIDRSVSAKVSEVSRSAKNTGGQYLVKLRLAKIDSFILPGMFINASIQSISAEGAQHIFIPQESLVENGQLKGVYTLSEDGKAILRWLRTGKTSENKVEVLSGLKEGEQVIISSESRLHNGATVSL
ncbi:MAG: efflux transporter periplasmic adaptor subunit [Flavobacteriales bacterium]|nr:efflux transporter periplasmic adaptor subunit [Flavobacteriales bacterium]|tara:strand:+ start:1027 stop:2106 length:1080 start_codon:yes stop_codon:yes gene_type:complete